MGVLSHQTSTYLALARFDLSEDFFRSLGGLHSESIDVTGKTTKTTFKSLKYPKCGARLAQMLGILRGSLWSRQWFHKKHLLWGERIPHRILLILASGALKDRHICEMRLQWETTNWQYIQGCLHAKKPVWNQCKVQTHSQSLARFAGSKSGYQGEDGDGRLLGGSWGPQVNVYRCIGTSLAPRRRLCFVKDGRIYGRYWGYAEGRRGETELNCQKTRWKAQKLKLAFPGGRCAETEREVSFLHFECCYYAAGTSVFVDARAIVVLRVKFAQAIEHAIQHGYEPVPQIEKASERWEKRTKQGHWTWRWKQDTKSNVHDWVFTLPFLDVWWPYVFASWMCCLQLWPRPTSCNNSSDPAT